VDTAYTPSIKNKVRSAGKVFCSSQGWTCTNTGCVMRYCMAGLPDIFRSLWPKS